MHDLILLIRLYLIFFCRLRSAAVTKRSNCDDLRDLADIDSGIMFIAKPVFRFFLPGSAETQTTFVLPSTYGDLDNINAFMASASGQRHARCCRHLCHNSFGCVRLKNERPQLKSRGEHKRTGVYFLNFLLAYKSDQLIIARYRR